MKLATTERKTNGATWAPVAILDFALHDNHMLNANVFMRPLYRSS